MNHGYCRCLGRLITLVLVLTAAGAWASGCARDRSETLVRLHVTSDEIGFQLASVSVMQRIGGSGREPRQDQQVLAVGYGGHALPLIVEVRPADPSDEWVEFRVDGLWFSGEVLVTRRSWTAFVSGQIVDLEVRLERACRQGTVVCYPGEQCVGGVCTPIDDPPGMGCGNGYVEIGWGEDCDDTNAEETDDCLSNCQAARCGDGVIWTGVEECDDFNTEPGDDCTASCTVARCGDGVVRTGIEECDDGNGDQNDACLNDCRAATCGDGIVQVGAEECDLEPDRPCTAPCGSAGTERCMLCLWDCQPPAETCNGLDDDCDGAVDEDFPCPSGADVACTTVCGSTGSGACSLSCALPSGAACRVPAERCNGVDEDCDGMVDDGCGCAAGWETMVTGATAGLESIWGTGPEDVFACGIRGAIVHFDGVRWSSMMVDTDELLNGIWGSGPTNVYAVGEDGVIMRFDGETWSSMESGTFWNLNAVWGSGPTDIYAAGEQGTLLHSSDGESWTTLESGTETELRRIGGSSASDVFVSGQTYWWDATILHYDGSGWSLIAVDVSEFIYGLWVTGPRDAYLVGENGMALRCNGTQVWSIPEATTNNLYSVWGSSANRIIAVGERGDMFLWNGSSWSSIRTAGVGSTTLLGVWGSGPNTVFVVGGFEWVMRRCGSGW